MEARGFTDSYTSFVHQEHFLAHKLGCLDHLSMIVAVIIQTDDQVANEVPFAAGEECLKVFDEVAKQKLNQLVLHLRTELAVELKVFAPDYLRILSV